MKKQILATESFHSNKRHYFLDFKVAENKSNYIQITRSEQQQDDSYKRWQVIVFENDFEQFISAFASLFQSAAYHGKSFETVQEIHEQVKQQKGIKAIEPEQRPREKLMTRGGNSLTNAELLALLIGSGSADESAVELGQKIMVRAGKKPAGLKNLTLSHLCSLHGMGVAKSCSILAAVELARRLYDCPPPEFKTVYLIRNPDDELPFFGS
jgi:DNA repair protein RadC